MTIEPKPCPCPFCGGEAEIILDHTVEENHAYGCMKCRIWFDKFNSENAEAEWNTRAAIEAPDHLALVAAAYRDAAAWLLDMRAVDDDGNETTPEADVYITLINSLPKRTPADAEAHLTALLRAEYERGAARTRLLEKALTVAIGNLAPQQPGDSRAVDDWFVACAAVQAELDDADGKIERCLDDALALLTQEGR